MAKSSSCNCRYPIWTWFMAQLLCFPSSSLLVAWESSWRWLKALGPCTYVGDLEEVHISCLWLTQHWLLWSLGEWIIRWKIFLSVSPPLCISDFAIKINKSFKKTVKSTLEIVLGTEKILTWINKISMWRAYSLWPNVYLWNIFLIFCNYFAVWSNRILNFVVSKLLV